MRWQLVPLRKLTRRWNRYPPIAQHHAGHGIDSVIVAARNRSAHIDPVLLMTRPRQAVDIEASKFVIGNMLKQIHSVESGRLPELLKTIGIGNGSSWMKVDSSDIGTKQLPVLNQTKTGDYAENGRYEFAFELLRWQRRRGHTKEIGDDKQREPYVSCDAKLTRRSTARICLLQFCVARVAPIALGKDLTSAIRRKTAIVSLSLIHTNS